MLSSWSSTLPKFQPSFFYQYFLIIFFIYKLWFYKWWEHLYIKGSSIKPIFSNIWALGGSSLDACGLSLPCGGFGEGFKTVYKLLALNMESATTCFMDEEPDTLLSLILLSGISIWWKFVLKYHDMIPFVVQFSQYLSAGTFEITFKFMCYHPRSIAHHNFRQVN